MKRNKPTKKDLSRRDFIKTTAVGVSATALTGLGATEATAEVVNWDKEADVVVVGFGAGGSAAAIEAHDAGADVILLEKMPEGLEGGSTGVCGGLVNLVEKVDIEKMRLMTFGTLDDEFLRISTDAVKELPGWLEGMGLQIQWVTPPYYGNVANNGRGVVWFATLKAQVNQRRIQVLYETPATKLIQDPGTKAILGVKVKSEGWDKYIRARRGVILTTGGYAHNLEMLGLFNHPGVYMASNNSPAATGDGMKMAMDVGARLKTLAAGVEWTSFGYKVASQLNNNVAVGTSIPANSYVFVDKYGKRFMNEKKSMSHQKEPLDVLWYKGDYSLDPKVEEYPHIPFFIVFDNKVMKAGPIASRPPATGNASGWNDVRKCYEWSADNSAELAKGWIVKADTIEELAAKLTAVDWFGRAVSVDPAGLASTVSNFKDICAAGVDPAFGRTKASLVPLETPPYYAAELCLVAMYTLGGPKHNVKAQILDTDNKPIPRLYAAGDVSSYGIIRPTAVPGALAFGRIAGRNAAAESSR